MPDIVKHSNIPDMAKCKLGFPLSDKVQLKHVRQIKGTFETKPVASNAAKTVEITNSASVDVDTDNNIVFVSADFNLTAMVEEEKEPVVTATATFLLMYEVPDLDGFTDEIYKSFGETNGIFNAWPYWREYVQTATVRMGLPALTIPVFRVIKPEVKDTLVDAESTVDSQGE